jgi:hypothetical protein
MADFYTPVGIPRPVFDQLIVRLDKAVGEHGVALVLNENFPFRALDPIRANSIDLSGLQIDNADEVVENLDQLLYFAFEDAPRDVVASWANDGEADLADEAFERVRFIRDNMPELAALWYAKSDSLIPPLIRFSYDAIPSEEGSSNTAVIYLAAAGIGPGARPDKTDIVRLRVQLWPSDVRLLAREFEHLWHAHLAESSDQPTGDEVDVDTNKASS